MKKPPLQQQSFFRRRAVWVVLFLTVSTAMVYVPVLRQDFVHYDDPGYAFNNPNIRNGLNGESIRWSFTTFEQANWHPLTWLSLIVDYRIFDGKAWGFKLVNLLLHITNTLLLFWLLNRMTGAFWSSAFVAALFALHPLHVESVVWVSERKDLLSSLFWFLTMIFYVRYAEQPGLRRYWPIPMLFALGLMAKPMLVTLPFVLLLIDLWPMRRLKRSENRKNKKNQPVHDPRFPPHSLSFLVMEKIPLFLLVIGSCIITFIAQRHGGSVATLDTFDVSLRIQNAVVAYMSYLGKMVWPGQLAPFYPHPGASISKAAVLFSSLVLIGITTVVLWQRKKRPYLPVGWFWYLGALVPVIGLVQVGAQSMADRYTYIPLIGIFIMITWWIGQPGRPKPIPAGIAAAVLAALGAVTFYQTGFWKDTLTLGNRVVQVSPNAYVGQTLLGIGYNKEGEYQKAIAHLSQSLRLRPDKAICHTYLADSFIKLGLYDKTLPHILEAIRLGEDSQNIYYEKGYALAKLGRLDQACQAFREALRRDPENPIYLHEMALSLAQNHQLDEAIQYFQLAINCQKEKTDPQMYNNLGHAWLLKNEYGKAIPYFQQAIAIDPDFMLGHLNLNKVLILAGRIDEAIRRAQQYAQSRPNDPNALYIVGAVQVQLGQRDNAIRTFQNVLRIQPGHADAKRELGRLLQK